MHDIAGIPTDVIVEGDGPSVLLLHGSGPGVTAAANWSRTIPALTAAGHRVIAPDLVGFGRTVPPEDHVYGIDSWIAHIIALLDTLGVDRTSIVGNSFGGALTARIAATLPERVDRIVLMGAAGVPFELTEGLDTVWGYTPTVENMRAVMDVFAYDRSLISDDLVQLRFTASVEGGAAERFARMFPEPRQRWLDALATDDEGLRSIAAKTLIVHGREDRVVPVATALRFLELIPDAQLHVFGQCGHWTQIEKMDEFNRLVVGFFA